MQMTSSSSRGTFYAPWIENIFFCTTTSCKKSADIRICLHLALFCNPFSLKLQLFPILCRPDLIEFDNLKRSNAHYNLQNAFNVAEKELGLTKLLDPEGECLKPQQQQKHSCKSH